MQWEEEEQIRRSLERRLKGARLGRFKAIDQFDWNWPTRCDRGAIEAILTLDFIQEAANVILIGPNGVGKTMLATSRIKRSSPAIPCSAPLPDSSWAT